MFLIFRFFPKQTPPPLIRLSKEERRHIAARRIQAGSALYVSDGRSRRWPALLLEGLDTLKISHKYTERREPRRLVCVALPKRKKLLEQNLLSGATELGMTHLQALLCERSVKANLHKARIEKILLAAASQSQRFFLPRVLHAKELSELRSFFAALVLAAK